MAELSVSVEEDDVRKIAKFTLWLLVLLLLATFAYHRGERCYQCGAGRHVYLTTAFWPNLFISKGEFTDAYRDVVGKECPHGVWERTIVWMYIVHLDCMPQLPIDECRRHSHSISKLPNREWQQQVLLALGHQENVLKWPAAMVLTDALDYRPPESESAWALWWRQNEAVFEIQPDPDSAIAIAAQAIQRCRETSYREFKYKIIDDLPGVH